MATDSRSQHKNKRTAFRRMAESKKFKLWANIQAGQATEDVDRWLSEQMRPENLTIEYSDSFH